MAVTSYLQGPARMRAACGRRLAWSIQALADSQPSRFSRDNRPVDQFVPVKGQDLKTSRTLLAGPEIHKAHNSMVFKAVKHGQFPEVFVKRD